MPFLPFSFIKNERRLMRAERQFREREILYFVPDFLAAR